MDKDPRLMTAEEYGWFLVTQISETPKGDLREQMVEALMNLRDELDHLESCYDLNPYE